MKKLKIAAVEYINTLPFLQGLRTTSFFDQLEIEAVNPATCANLFYDSIVDVALVPVGSLHQFSDYKIITEYCIGSEGPVDTVAVLSDKPIAEVERIVLDPHSRTSAMLIQILCNKYWQLKNIHFTDVGSEGLSEGYLFIGDKVKEKEKQFSFKYDLGEAWTNMTSRPMVFAVWVARLYVDDNIISKLNAAFKVSLNSLDKLNLQHCGNALYWRNYLKNSIRFKFDETAKQGLKLFLQYAEQLIRV